MRGFLFQLFVAGAHPSLLLSFTAGLTPRKKAVGIPTYHTMYKIRITTRYVLKLEVSTELCGNGPKKNIAPP